MTSLNTVEKLTNKEILDGLILEYENIVERLVDTGSSIQITRTVKPEEETSKSDFKEIHNQIKNIVETDFTKTRGSNELITTVQELKLVPSNDVEEQKVSVLLDQLRFVFGYEDFPYDKSTLDRLFSGNASFENVVINYGYGVSATRLNDMNELVNDFWVSPLGHGRNGNKQPRTVLIESHSQGLPHQIYEHLHYAYYNTSWRRDDEKGKLIQYESTFDWLDMDFEISNTHDTDFSVEYINSLDPTFLFQNLSSVQDELKTLNEKITAYEESISIPVGEFLELFPLVAGKLESTIEHSNKLSRKIVKVEVSKIYEVEIDVVDEGDIEPALSDVFGDVPEKGISTYLSLENGDHLKELSSKFGGVSIVEVKDFNEEIEKVA